MHKKWWHNKIAYQIYLKSFYDTNGDGIGDLTGLIQKLEYFSDLGVDILWICPIYKSPLADQGYDIADYYDIDPRFGTMEQMQTLIHEAKKRNIYILMDLVVNHCSDEHAWFQAALADLDSEYADYFYIARTENDLPPNNLRSYFGGSAWEPIPDTNASYLHLYHKKQPDLNWENPVVRDEVIKNINWWLDLGLGGFRIDAIMNIKKDLPFRNYPADRADGMVSPMANIHAAQGIDVYLNEMKDKAFVPHDAFSVGEVYDQSVFESAEILDYIGENGYFSTIFDFSTTMIGQHDAGWYAYSEPTPKTFRDVCFQTQRQIGTQGLIANIIENHDTPRGASRFLPPEGRTDAGKKMLATLYFFLRGIPFIYQGQEIGMENTSVDTIDAIDDIFAVSEYNVALEAGLTPEQALEAVQKYSRDNTRTPFQWDDTAQAGFTSGKPWLAVNQNFTQINLASQMDASDSVFCHYQRMIALRKRPDLIDLFVYGTCTPVLTETDTIFAYVRAYNNKKILIIGNYDSNQTTCTLPAPIGEVLLENGVAYDLHQDTLTLGGFAVLVVALQ